MTNNYPFYFALVPGRRPAAAVAHIAATFGIKGKAEFVSAEQGYRLCRIVAAQ